MRIRKDLDQQKTYIINCLLVEQKSISEICVELNCKYDTLRSRIKKWLPEYVPDNTKKLKTYAGKNKWSSLEEYVNSKGKNCKRTILHRLLIEKYGDVCSECGMQSFWNGKYLRLQVDHIDGECYNNSISNLRLLCPNCHSQTETFSSKKSLARVVEW